jgi:hypothetical protein
MRRLFIPMFLALVATQFQVSSAAACINDRDTSRTEQEFKKNYEFKSGFTSEPIPTYDSQPAENQWVATAAVGSGASLLLLSAGLMAVNFCKPRRS